jgi:hypothetical protein
MIKPIVPKQFVPNQFILGICIAITLAGCANVFHSPQTEEMYITASALTKLSASVESTVRYKNPPDGIADEDLLRLATEHDPSLLNPFFEYRIKILRDNRHSAVLVCTKDGAEALLEDAGCTAALDKHRWQTPAEPCIFTLKLSEVCVTHNP